MSDLEALLLQSVADPSARTATAPADSHATRRYIGSTDIGPVLALYRPEMASLAKYQTASDVWLRIVHGIAQPQNSRMSRGLDAEPVLRDLYRSTVGPVSEPPGVIAHPSHVWACGSPDGLTGDAGLVEYKTTTVWAQHAWGEPGTDKTPDSYTIQAQWLLECAGREWAHLLVAFGTDGKGENGEPVFGITETAVYQFERDAELCAALVEAGQRFWVEHVSARVPPGVEPAHNKRAFKRLQNERKRVGEFAHLEAVDGDEAGRGDGGR